MPTDDLVLRPAEASDAGVVAAVHLAARRAAPMPPSVHTDEEVGVWLAARMAHDETWVAERGGEVTGYVRLSGSGPFTWLDDLYVVPGHARSGVGSALLDVAFSLRPGGFCLWVFEENAPARAFYRHHGLVELETTDGSANEEGAPDLRVAWPGEDPLLFFRGLIDEVDLQLGDLLARRAALTRAVQPHKSDTSRDLRREVEIASSMAQRAPDLGPERLQRIVHTIITESLDAARS